MWYLATIIDGINHAPWATGRHCYVSRTATGMVKVIGAKGVTVILKLDEARRRVRVSRDKDGEPVRVRGQIKQDAKWQEREGRRFDGRPQRIVA